MKSFIEAAVIAALIAAPLAAFAQSNQPLTRAEVRADLVRVEQAGYNPHDWYHYPANIQAAEARIAAEKGASASYGSGSNGSSQAGQRAVSQ
ncbi:DUF4148 domain-containing protein [Paraburkholderia sp. BCC1885]|uniref:DUF4148 domain-containing protein n=1 Tax=Paraburkholderia sp. BCC1885 TaxID=2562669 RepID=UPI001183BA8B|nr:DUF4148 domain-containing protein [Paraburkholderia sp. BCC1885]